MNVAVRKGEQCVLRISFEPGATTLQLVVWFLPGLECIPSKYGNSVLGCQVAQA